MKIRLVLLLVAAWPGTATAHLVSTRFGELYSGMLHPLTTLQHLLPWLALGLLGGLQPPGTARWALLVFPVMVMAGTAAADMLPGLGYAEAVNALSFIVLGALVTLGVELSRLVFLVLAGAFGLSHGYANAAPELGNFGYLLYALGVGLAAYLLVALVAAGSNAMALGRSWGAVAVRAAGSWIAAAGAMYISFLYLAA